ncbi:MAG: HNH endonuclease family protein [Clostridia bacterium]
MVYLNEYLFAKDNKLEFNITSDIDIEHIMPQSGKNINTIQQDAKIENADMWREYVNKIGNKILLEYDINRSIGNEWFRTKVSTKIKDKSGYIDSKYPLARFLVEKYKNQNKPFWTKDDIDNMTKKAVNRIAKFIFND